MQAQLSMRVPAGKRCHSIHTARYIFKRGHGRKGKKGPPMRMRLMIVTTLSFLWMSGPALSAGDLDALQGDWTMTGLSAGGNEAPAEYFQQKKPTYWVTGDKYEIRENGTAVETGTIKVIEDRSPRQIDFVIETGKDAGKTQRGIYKLEGDLLTISANEDGKEYPTEFSGAAGHAQMVMKRGTAAPASPAPAASAAPSAESPASPEGEVEGEEEEGEGDEEEGEDKD